MKRLFLLPAISCLSIFVFSACGDGGRANTSTTAGNAKASPGNTVAAPAKPAEAAKTGLKPEDVSSDRPVKVIELADAAIADEAAWRDKEVTVSGYVWDGSGAGEGIVTVTDDEKAVPTITVSCHLEGKKPDGLNNKTVEFKGKISYLTKYGESKGVNLRPCELKK